ncbi:MAG: MarR family transcriptional regulator [Rhodospirillales bacterium]
MKDNRPADSRAPQAKHLEEDRLAHLVRHVARGLTRSLQIRLAKHDVQFGSWVFLRILWEDDGLTQRELAERAGLMQSTTHTALLKLEGQGYLTRRHPEGDRKKLLVFLTEQGRAARDVLQPLAEEVNDASVQGLSGDDIRQLRQALLIMAGNLDADEQRALEDGRGVPATRGRNGQI